MLIVAALVSHVLFAVVLWALAHWVFGTYHQTGSHRYSGAETGNDRRSYGDGRLTVLPIVGISSRKPRSFLHSESRARPEWTSKELLVR